MTHRLPLLNNRPWVRNRHIQHLFSVFEEAGAELRFVGGAVRNALLRRPVNEIDMAVNIPPERVLAIAQDAGLQALTTGFEHGTVTFLMGQEPVRRIEVTSLREDIRTDGRHAEVSYTTSWREDARRRDFTMNALYCSREGVISDPLDVREDVYAGLVKFIENPEKRVEEDFLRILRFFRFSAHFGDGKLDAAGLAACEKLQAGLEMLSPERKGHEFLRLLTARQPLLVLKSMNHTGIYEQVLPLHYDPLYLEGVIAFEGNFGFAPDPIRRLTALILPTFEKVSVDVKIIQDKLALSSKQRELIAQACILSKDVPTDLKAHNMRKYLYMWGPEIWFTMLSLVYARSNDRQEENWLNLLYEALMVARPIFPLSGDDLIAEGYSPGPDLGAELRRLEEVWVAHDFNLSREDLLALAE